MRVELVDFLRCVRPHDETWLVAAADRVEQRDILEGVLGCPACQAEYPVRDGVADFAGGSAPRARSMVSGTGPALRLAAMLDLTDARGWVLLLGCWGSLAYELQSVVPVPLLLVNPPAGVRAGEGVSILLARDVLPVATGAARAVALDPEMAWCVQPGVRAVRAGGRVVGASTLPLPEGVRALARDDEHWVGERDAPPSALVTLGGRSDRGIR